MKVAFFDTKDYDRQAFEPYVGKNSLEFQFYDTKLCGDTAELARGCDVVCVFVNDDVNAAVVEKLHSFGVQLIALRCAGYNNVDLAAAFGKIHVVQVPPYSPYAVAEHAMEKVVDRLCDAICRLSNATIKSITGRDWIIESLIKILVLSLSTLGHTGANAAFQRPGWAGMLPVVRGGTNRLTGVNAGTSPFVVLHLVDLFPPKFWRRSLPELDERTVRRLSTVWTRFQERDIMGPYDKGAER